MNLLHLTIVCRRLNVLTFERLKFAYKVHLPVSEILLSFSSCYTNLEEYSKDDILAVVQFLVIQ